MVHFSLVVQETAPKLAKSQSGSKISGKIVRLNLDEQNFALQLKQKRPPGSLWFDTGCKRCVGGADEHVGMRARLALIGLKPIIIAISEEFIFGNGKTTSSDCFLVSLLFGQ